MKQKVIVISAQIYSLKTADNYFKSSFENDDFDFEFWSIAECNVYKNPFNVEVSQHKVHNIYNFKDIKIVKKKIEQFKDESVYFFIYFPTSLKTYHLLKLISKKSIKVFKLDYNISISSFTKKNDSFIDKIRYFGSLSKIYNLFFFKALTKHIQNSKNFKNIILFNTGGIVSKERSITFDDYFEFINLDNNKFLTTKYIVFVDAYLPHHPDFKMNGFDTIDAGTYYLKMNSFFDKIEKQFNLPIVIAAHPKSNYQNEFGNRQIFKNKTALLIKDSEFVLNHFSSSISFIALAKKPLLYIYTNEFLNKKSHLYNIFKRISFQSNYFNVPAINIDEDENIILPESNNPKYDTFINDFLVSLSYPLSNYQIVKQHFLK